MPSSRRMKVTALTTLLTFCVIFYITHGASSTHNSEFYTRTVNAIQDKQRSKLVEDLIAQEHARLSRVERIEKEHNAALSAAKGEETRRSSYGSYGSRQPNPVVPGSPSDQRKSADGTTGEKTVAGRKSAKDGKIVDKGPDGDGDDGVAKVGNVGAHSSHPPTTDDKEDKAVEAALNDILRKGPIIIFSKTYCPFSAKAKHILLDLYAITPPPHVVELNNHELGDGIQAALAKLTSRRTVPNVMINGKSIGGGDDIEELHENDELASKILSLGGKRMTRVERLDKKSEMKFRA